MSYVMKGDKLSEAMTAPDALLREALLQLSTLEMSTGTYVDRADVLDVLDTYLAATPPASAVDPVERLPNGEPAEMWGGVITPPASAEREPAPPPDPRLFDTLR